MKKITLLLIALVLMFSFVACETDNEPTKSTNPPATSTPEATPSATVANVSELMAEVLKTDRFEDGTYSMKISFATDDDKTAHHYKQKLDMNGYCSFEKTIKDFSFSIVDSSREEIATAGVYVKGDTVYFMENDGGEDEIFSMNVSDYPGFNMFRDYFNIVDVQEIFNSAQNSSFRQKEDKSYDVSITCDTSKDLGFIENIDLDFSAADEGWIVFNTTECKINMNISEDFFVTKINIEFSQTAETIEMTYTCKYEISFISSDNTVAPPAGMDIEKAETRE